MIVLIFYAVCLTALTGWITYKNSVLWRECAKVMHAQAAATESLIERLQRLQYDCETLYDAIKHGDAAHQEWLKNKLNAHFERRIVV